MPDHIDIKNLPANHKQKGWLPLTRQANGQTLQLPFLYVTGADAGPTLVVTAGVHGDEYEGIAVIMELFDKVETAGLRGRLLMMPVCNLPAYEAATRSSPLDGQNLARVFPGSASGTTTERIAHWITENLLSAADFYIDLHSGGVAYEIPTLIGYTFSDSRLGQQSRAAARAFGAPVMWGHPPPQPPGRTISTATDLEVPALYTEAPGGGYARAEDIACFVDGVLNVMNHLGMVAEPARRRPLTHHLVGNGDLDQVISAPAGGFFRARVKLLDEVKSGDLLGIIYDLLGNEIATINADRDGVIILLRRLHRVHAGDGLVHITGWHTS